MNDSGLRKPVGNVFDSYRNQPDIDRSKSSRNNSDRDSYKPGRNNSDTKSSKSLKKTGNIPKHHKLSGGAIVAIVIGCLVIIGGIIGVVIYLASNKDDKEAKNKSNLKKAIDQSVSQYNKLVTQLENSLRCDGSCRNLHRYCCKIRTRQNLIWRNTFTETVVPTEDS